MRARKGWGNEAFFFFWYASWFCSKSFYFICLFLSLFIFIVLLAKVDFFKISIIFRKLSVVLTLLNYFHNIWRLYIHIYIYIYIYVCVCVCVCVCVFVCVYIHIKKLATIVEGDLKAPFSIATTPRCRGGRYSFPGLLYFTLDPTL